MVDDEEDILKKMDFFLKDLGYSTFLAKNGQEGWELVQTHPIDIVITDLKMPKMGGMELLKLVKEEFPQIEVIIITGHGDVDAAVQALRYGALDFLQKPLKLGQLEASLVRSSKFLHTRRENLALKEVRKMGASSLDSKLIIGRSPAIQEVKQLIQNASKYDTTVLITGESGTGKELVAKAIHYASSRKGGPFVTVNCSAIPESLVESEFFGHRKGSFTGAHENKRGFFQTAHGGTIFLDEIGDMPLNAQMKLLRVLEEKKIKPVGYRYDIEINVRILAATNQNLEELIQKGRFRQDLYFRLNVFPIHLPPLSERKDDIPLLVEHFVQSLGSQIRKRIREIDPKIFEKLKHYSFPGNVRELKNMVERALILSKGDVLTWKDFEASLSNILHHVPEEPEGPQSLNIREHEEYLIRKALQKTNHNRHQAAKLLGISWSTLDRKMKQLELYEHEGN
ncbi:MAG: sigma-54-dependent Fis family transcriptional regulator [Planctomycetota bacterium]|nr:MAG: sigma-54-dependent Fis family transcriptional regulator [Planctomycetota bacterium]